LNAVDAAGRGARILTRTRLLGARRDGALWRATLQDKATGAQTTLEARMLVNAAGPYVSDVLGGRLGVNSQRRTRLVKGSHIVVKRLYRGDHAYILQNPDRRIVFTIPYERRYTLIGTTDEPFEGDPAGIAIAPHETQYLCDSVNRWFARPVDPDDIVWSYAGVRALFDDGSKDASEVTRDYVLDLDAPQGGAKLLSVFGGKITTYRRLAEQAMTKLGIAGAAWTATKPLPGGDIPDGNFTAFAQDLAAAHPFLPATLARRLARAYGSRATRILGRAVTMAALGEDFGGGLTAAEVDYLVREEFARTADDILWRRSKLGLHVPADTATKLSAYLGEK
jgi:glycerol-3-phosphate dehydrogenase